MRAKATCQPTASESTPKRSSVLRRAIPWITTLLVLSAPLASAGEPEAVEIPQQGSLWNWFVGGSGGYLFDNETEFGALQVGVDLPFEFAGFQQSVYLEVGRFKTSSSFGSNRCWHNERPGGSTGGCFGGVPYGHVDFDVIPMTLNWAVERKFTETLSGYFGGGLGLAVVTADRFSRQSRGFMDGENSSYSSRDSAEDIVLYGQLFGGATAHVSEHLELFAGARAVFMGDPDVKAFGQDVGDHLSETDVLIEAGARITF